MTQSKQTTEEIHITEHNDGSITIHHPKGKRRNHAIAALLESDDVLREKVGGFADFLKEYAVVGLAVGFIVGQQANGVVKQLVASFVDPLAQIWFGHNLSTTVAVVHHGAKPVDVPWGAFVFTLLEFFLVLIIIYILIKVFKLDKFKKIDPKK
jgi:large conductance mechanosensitive channel